MELLKSAYIFKLKFEESSGILKKYLSTIIEQKQFISIESDSNDDINSNFDNKLYNEKTNKTVNRQEENLRQTKNIHYKRKSKLEYENGSSDVECTAELSPLYPCPICTMELPATELRQHAHSHKALKKYLNIPKVKENTKFYANPRNTVSLFIETEILHKCPFCNKDYPAQQFRIHVDNHRKEDEFKCDNCERVFRKLNHLNTHRVKHLKEYPYKCDRCGKGFVIKKNYDCHMLTHTNNELPLECSYCLKRFSNPEHLHRHQIIHTENVSYSEKYKVCKCHHCLKTFKDKETLKNHLCVPIEQAVNTKFPCKTCDKVFKHSSGLYNHIRNNHKLKSTKTLCSVCGSYVSNIYNHMMRHTGEKPYPCNQCDKRFASKPQLKQHLLVHSGLKPFVCSVCAKAFNNLYNLQVHERIHKGNRCHICPVCNKGFLEKSYLKKHMNVHKNIN